MQAENDYLHGEQRSSEVKYIKLSINQSINQWDLYSSLIKNNIGTKALHKKAQKYKTMICGYQTWLEEMAIGDANLGWWWPSWRSKVNEVNKVNYVTWLPNLVSRSLMTMMTFMEVKGQQRLNVVIYVLWPPNANVIRRITDECKAYNHMKMISIQVKGQQESNVVNHWVATTLGLSIN